MTLWEQLQVGWKICSGAVLIAGGIGAFAWNAYTKIDTWKRAREADHAVIRKMLGEYEAVEDWVNAELVRRERLKLLADAVAQLQQAAVDGARNTETHCRLGTLSREWCLDQKYKVPDAPKGAGG